MISPEARELEKAIGEVWEIAGRMGLDPYPVHFEMVPAGLKLEYRDLTPSPLPDAYENVFNEVLQGGHTVFPGPREIERSWEIVDPLLRGWEESGRPLPYARGSWGPTEADSLVAARGGRWINSGEEPGT